MATTKKKNTGLIVLNTSSAAAIWQVEITGQLSDGMWENSTPLKHWQPWCDLVVLVDKEAAPHVVGPYFPKKNYNLRKLFNIGGENPTEVRDRMVQIGRMACAMEHLSTDKYDHNILHAAIYMPVSLGVPSYALGYWRKCKESGVWPDDGETFYIRKYMESVSDELATAYYQHMHYDLKQMRDDIDRIKAAMMTADGC